MLNSSSELSQPLLTSHEQFQPLYDMKRRRSSSFSETTPRGVGYQASKQRWAVLAAVALGQTMCNLIFATLNPLSIQIARAFDLNSVFYVNLAIAINMVNSVPMTFVCIYLYSRFNWSTVLRFVTTLLMIGAILRASCLWFDNFWPVAIGSYICSCCNPFFINCQSIISNKWFTDKERALATALMTVSMPLGSGLSFALNSYWFSNENFEFKGLFKTLLVTQCIMAITVWILFNIMVSEKPATPPSAVATVPYEALDFKQSFRALWKNPNFLLLGISFALPFGSVLAVGALMSNLFDPFGYTPAELSTLALLMLGSGVVGAVLVGALIDRTGLYKIISHIILFLTTLSSVMIVISLKYFSTNENLFSGWIQFLGFVSTGFIPLSLSFGAELTFPLQPALVNGTLTLLGSAAAFLLTLVGSFLNHEGNNDHLLAPEELEEAKKQRSLMVLSMLAIGSGTAFIISLFIKEDLKRLRYHEKKKVKLDQIHEVDEPERTPQKATDSPTNSDSPY